jgi:tyrosine-protein kinase Etk/Wzc
MARAGLKTLAIDIDIRSQGLTKSFAKTESAGLIDFLNDSQTLLQSIHHISEHLDILPAGIFVENASELLMTTKMLGLLEELAKRYHMIVIDSAPILIVSDALNLLSSIDEVILIARAGVTRLEELSRSLEQVSDGGGLCQMVLNMSGSLGSYYYGQRSINRSISNTRSKFKQTG